MESQESNPRSNASAINVDPVGCPARKHGAADHLFTDA